MRALRYFKANATARKRSWRQNFRPEVDTRNFEFAGPCFCRSELFG
jgi:hypothetical protein